jgi:hypothetical protein
MRDLVLLLFVVSHIVIPNRHLQQEYTKIVTVQLQVTIQYLITPTIRRGLLKVVLLVTVLVVRPHRHLQK